MICPYCGGEKTRVTTTIKSFENRRFRVCLSCKKSFSTIEHVFYDDYLKDYFKETAPMSSKAKKDE